MKNIRKKRRRRKTGFDNRQLSLPLFRSRFRNRPITSLDRCPRCGNPGFVYACRSRCDSCGFTHSCDD